jgi:hypothetical protein
MKMAVVATLGLIFLSATARAQSPSGDDFGRAESDRYLADLVKDAGGLGNLPTTASRQTLTIRQLFVSTVTRCIRSAFLTSMRGP